jgi:hypothetical protein
VSNSYTKAAFCILMSPADVTTLNLAEKAVDILDTVSDDEDLKLSFDALGVGFHKVFPAKGPNDFGSFLQLFDDPAYPRFGCSIDIEEPGTNGLCEVTFTGEQIEVEAIARLIFAACKSALPCGFEWAHDADRLRVGEFGGGTVVITAAGIQYHSTRDVLDRANIREISEPDEAVDGLVMVLRDKNGLRFWNNRIGFGSLADAKVFSKAEADRLNKTFKHGTLKWLALPAPLTSF